MRLLSIVLVAIALVSLPALGQGLANSLSIMLPARPLPSGRGDLQVGALLLPSGRPDLIDRSMSKGAEAVVHYGIWSQLAVGIRGWTDLDGITRRIGFHGGIGADAIVMLAGDTTHHWTGLMPHGALLLDNGSVEGVAAGLRFVIWFPPNGIIAPYGGLGAIAQWNTVPLASDYFALSLSPGSDAKLEYGVVGNLGVSIHLSPSIRATVELAGGILSSVYIHSTAGVVAPEVGIAWAF